MALYAKELVDFQAVEADGLMQNELQRLRQQVVDGAAEISVLEGSLAQLALSTAGMLNDVQAQQAEYEAIVWRGSEEMRATNAKLDGWRSECKQLAEMNKHLQAELETERTSSASQATHWEGVLQHAELEATAEEAQLRAETHRAEAEIESRAKVNQNRRLAR